MDESAGFSTTQVAELTGVPAPVLGYWDRSGFLSPSLQKATGSGSRRRYSYRDLIAVKMVKKLRREKIPLQKLRKAVSYLRSKFPRTEVSDSPLAQPFLIISGKDVLFQEGNLTISALQSPGQSLLYLVDLTSTVKELDEAILQLENTTKTAKPTGKAGQAG
jgi:DNA-binding transcriptional MerR regulator